MKNYVLTLFGCLIAGGLFAQQEGAKPANLTLRVDVGEMQKPVEKIVVSYYNYTANQRFTDSLLVGNNRIASLKLFLDEPVLSQLRVVYAKTADTGKVPMINYSRDMVSVYLEPGEVAVVAADSMEGSSVKGSSSHMVFQGLRRKAAAFDPAFKAFNEAYMLARKGNDQTRMEELSLAIDSIENLRKESVYLPFLKTEGRNSAVAIHALSMYAGYAIQASVIEPLFGNLSAEVRDLPSALAFQKRIEKAKKTDIGQIAMPFSQKDTSGEEVPLSSFRGQYVLIDFWASWCGPCRQENPNLVDAFRKYREKGFTVLGVSLDQPNAREKWLKAIYEDQLTWTHVSDLKYWNNEVAVQYGIQAIPQNFLLDKEGRIISKNLRGEKLQTTLQQLFASP